jgi:hypothetical protein
VKALAALLSLFAISSAWGDCVVPTFKPSSFALDSVVTIAHGDLNGDHRVDVVYGTSVSGKYGALYVALGNGDGTFQPRTYLSTGNTSVRRVHVFDFDGDGKDDVLALTDDFNGHVFSYRGNGDGTFQEPVALQTRVIFSSVADVNQDGHPDLVVSNGYSIAMLLGAGVYNPQVPFSTASALNALIAADAAGDGRVELIRVPASSSQIEVQTVEPSRISAGWGVPYSATDPTVTLAGAAGTNAVIAADVTEDGIADLISLSPTTNSFTFYRGLGSYQFAPGIPVMLASKPSAFSSLYQPALASADLNGDGHADLIVANTGFELYTGNGNGGFAYASTLSGNALQADVADVDGDGRRDLLVATGSRAQVLLNNCGDAALALAADALLSVGQQTTVRLDVRTPVDSIAPSPTGSYTLREGSSVIGTYAIGSGATLSWPSAGDHTFTASYAGDAQYEPAESQPFTVHVTTATTTTQLMLHTNNTTYGSSWSIDATVTSSNGDTPTGAVLYTVDGGAPQSNHSFDCLPAGPHVFTGIYPGDATHPRSTSAPLTVTVRRGFLDMSPLQITSPPAGQPASVSYSAGHGCSITNGLSIYLDDTLITTAAFSSNPMTQSLGNATAGKHTVRVVYPGDANLEPLTTAGVQEVFPAGTLYLVARAGSYQVELHWNATTVGQTIYRRDATAAWQFLSYGSNGQYIDSRVQQGQAYAYYIQPTQGGTASNVQVVVSTMPTDDPIIAGVTPIRAAHLLELQTATNALRTLAGLPRMTFTEGAPAIGAFVRPSHVLELRDAINAARAALGAPQVIWSGTPVSGGFVRASDVQQLRDALQ